MFAPIEPPDYSDVLDDPGDESATLRAKLAAAEAENEALRQAAKEPEPEPESEIVSAEVSEAKAKPTEPPTEPDFKIYERELSKGTPVKEAARKAGVPVAGDLPASNPQLTTTAMQAAARAGMSADDLIRATDEAYANAKSPAELRDALDKLGLVQHRRAG
jgi:imidazolonepropionase-like amidohydrolase